MRLAGIFNAIVVCAVPKGWFCFKKSTALYLFLGLGFPALLASLAFAENSVSLEPMAIDSKWELQDSAKIPQTGAEIALATFQSTGWYPATVPGTALTSLVNDGIYPEPLYGENNRPDKIPESLCRTPYWYRTVFTVPSAYAGKRIWLNFEGINYAAEVWVNGKDIGAIKGAFARGVFDVSFVVTPGKQAVLAVLVSPQPHP